MRERPAASRAKRVPRPAVEDLAKRDRRLIEHLKTVPGIEEQTKRTWIGRVRGMAQMCGKSGLVSKIVHRPRVLLAAIYERWPSTETGAGHVFTIASVLKHDPSIGNDETRRFWSQALREAEEKTAAENKNNVATQKELKSMPDMEELARVVDDLERKGDVHATLDSSQRYLWLLIALTVPPKRSDYGSMRIIDSASDHRARENALVVPSRGPVTIILDAYKTHKHRGSYTEDVPYRLAGAIRASLKRHPRPFLFINAMGVPFPTKGSWSGWANRTFAKYMGDHTLTGLRKAWVQRDHDANNSTIAEQEELARRMLHSTRMRALRYTHVRR